MIEVEVGDTIVEFPDGTSPDVMRDAMRKRFGARGPMQGPEQPEGEKMSTGKSLQEGLLSGLTLNFRDELKGLSEASGVPGAATSALGPLGLAVRPGIGAARLGYEYLTGKGGEGSATETYERERDAQRSISKAAEEYAPVTNLLGNLGGSLVLPGGGALKGASLGARAARGAAIGGAAGGLSGLGEGTDLESRLTEGAKGAALGGAVGGVAAPVVEGLAHVPAIARRFNPLVGAIDPEGEAAKRVARAVSRDVEIDPTAAARLTPRDMAANPSAIIADLGGENTRALARSAANTSPEARLALSQKLDPRYETQGDRVQDWLESNFNFPTAAAHRAALETSARGANQTAYFKAYQAGSQPMASPELGRLAQSDIVQSAMRRASASAGDEALISGQKFQPYDLRYWDLVRREVSNEATKAGRGTEEARRATFFASAINKELDNLVPEYQAARQGAKSFFDAENALEAGENFVRMNKDLGKAKDEIAKMSATEQKLFQDGFLSRYVETLRAVPDRRNVLNTIAQSPTAREKLTTVLGQQKADELEAMLRVEGLMNLPRQAVQGNSSTARQLVELGLAGGAGGYLSGDWKTGIATAALAHGRFKVNQNVATKVGQMLASDDPQVLRNGIKLLARNKQMMENLRGFDQQIAKTAGAQSE